MSAEQNDDGTTAFTTYQPDGSVDVTTVHDNGAVNVTTADGNQVTEITVVPGEFAEQIDADGNVCTYDEATGTFTPEGSESNWI